LRVFSLRRENGWPLIGGSHRHPALQDNFADMVQPFDVLVGRPGIYRSCTQALIRVTDNSGL